jgi:hypothetical protein
MNQYNQKAKINYMDIFRSIWKWITIVFFYTKNTTIIVGHVIKRNMYNYLNPPTLKPVYKSEPEYETVYKKELAFFKTDPIEKANSNIEKDLYDYDKRKTIFSDSVNETEKRWKSRILIEHTYRGNVIMYYDSYRMAFAYYSDEQVVPHKALYHAAIKYVVRYRCRDFFIDMDVFPDNPMIEVLKKEDEILKTKSKPTYNPEGEIKKPVKKEKEKPNPVFAKLKDYRNQKDNTKDQAKDRPKDHPFSNKFVRMGKTCEFNITQRPPNKKIEAVNSLLFSDKPISKVADFFDDLSISVDESKIENSFSQEQLEKPAQKLSSYQLFKLKQQEKKQEEAKPI